MIRFVAGNSLFGTAPNGARNVGQRTVGVAITAHAAVAASCDPRRLMLPIENDHLPGNTPSADASADDRRPRDAHAAQRRSDGVQGEGNYDAARNFNSAERRFVEQGKVAPAARAAAPRSAAEQQAMLAAELQGKRHAKRDPAVRNASRKTGTLTLDKRG